MKGEIVPDFLLANLTKRTRLVIGQKIRNVFALSLFTMENPQELGIITPVSHKSINSACADLPQPQMYSR